MLDGFHYDRLDVRIGVDREVAAARLLLEVPRYLLWFRPANQAAAVRAHTAGWHLWAPSDAGAWDRPDLLARPPFSPLQELLVATWLGSTPKSAARTLMHLALDVEGCRDPSAWQIRVSLPDQREQARRDQAVRKLNDQRQALGQKGFSGWVNPVAGHCSACGRPLRDSLSIQRGVGRDCYERLLANGLMGNTSELRLTRADIPAERWVGLTSVSDWQQSIS